MGSGTDPDDEDRAQACKQRERSKAPASPKGLRQIPAPTYELLDPTRIKGVRADVGRMVCWSGWVAKIVSVMTGSTHDLPPDQRYVGIIVEPGQGAPSEFTIVRPSSLTPHDVKWVALCTDTRRAWELLVQEHNDRHISGKKDQNLHREDQKKLVQVLEFIQRLERKQPSEAWSDLE